MIAFEAPAMIGNVLVKQLAEEADVKVDNYSARHTKLVFENEQDLEAFKSLVEEQTGVKLIDIRTMRSDS